MSQDRKQSYDIRTNNLISLAFKQVLFKRSRAYITIGAISIAMGIIILLVSIGYGSQRVIVNRVANDLEVVQVDILPQAGKRMSIIPEVIRVINEIQDVEKTLPITSVVSKVELEGSKYDVVGYAVTKDFLEYSETLYTGQFFDWNDIPDETIEYVLDEEQQEDTKTEENLDEDNVQGTVTDIEWVELEEDTTEETVTGIVHLNSQVPLQIVVNMKILELLNIDPNDAVGKKFFVTYIAIEDLLGIDDRKVESEKLEYEIIGVVEDTSQPVFYVPLDHLWSMGTIKFSQARIIVNKKENVEQVRKELESRGFATKSILDTIEQIDLFFNIVRIALSFVGMGALFVASLGMFNTLTISLLERSKEIGLLKVLGMKSQQVYNLFITESLIMGLWGGILGIIIAFLGGKIISLIFSIFTFTRGGEIVDISYIPISYLFFSFGIMITVGFLTGFYPAVRATKISALDALRYE